MSTLTIKNPMNTLNSKSRVKVAGLMLASVIVASVGYGFTYVGSQDTPIWRKDASNVVVLTPNTLSLNIASSTVVTLPTPTLGGTCATATYDAPSMGTSTINLASASTTLTLTGAVAGNFCVGSLTTATSSDVSVMCNITGTASATVSLINRASTATDLASGTVKACLIK